MSTYESGKSSSVYPNSLGCCKISCSSFAMAIRESEEMHRAPLQYLPKRLLTAFMTSYNLFSERERERLQTTWFHLRLLAVSIKDEGKVATKAFVIIISLLVLQLMLVAS